MIENIKPMPGKLLCELLDGDYVSAGGILVVKPKEERKPTKAKVLKIGGAFMDPKDGKPLSYSAQPGQMVFFKMHKGQKFRFNGKNLIVLENEDIVAKE